MVSPLAKQLMLDLGMSHGMLMSVLGAPVIISIFLSLPGGALADRFGVKRVVAISITIAGIFGILRGLSTTYTELFVFTVISGFGLVPTLPKLVRDWFPRSQIGIATGIYTTGFATGLTLGLATTYPLFEFNWKLAFYSISGLVLLVSVIWSLLAKEKKGKIDEHSLSQELSMVFRHFDGWMCAMIGAFTLGGIMLFLGIFPLASEMVHSVSPATAGAVISLNTVGAIIGNAFVPLISDRVGKRKPIIFICGSLGAIALFLIWNLPFGALTWFLSFIAGVFISGLAVMPMVIITEHKNISSKILGTAAGFIISVRSVGQYFLPLLGGYIVDWTSYDTGFLASSIMVLISIIFAVVVSETGNGILLKTAGPARGMSY